MARRSRISPHNVEMTSGRHDGAGGNGARVESVIQKAMSRGEIVSVGVLNLVRSTLVAVLSGVREVGAEIATAAVAAVRGAIRAASDIGGDLGVVTKQAVRGAIQAADEIGGDLGQVARSTARGAVRAASEVGGDVAMVARRAVEGAADAAREIGVDVTKLARSAADGALEAAESIGGAARHAVRGGVARVSGTLRGATDHTTSRNDGGARKATARRAPLAKSRGRHAGRRSSRRATRAG